MMKWYDTWWWAISERFDSLHDLASWESDFFEHINQGWLEMYYQPPTEEEFIKSFLNTNPYYNEKYYEPSSYPPSY